MRSDLLLKLASHTDQIPPDEFNMEFFGQEDDNSTFCGCMAGHAAHSALFRGFKLWTGGPPAKPLRKQKCDVEYRDKYSFEAISLFFGLTLEETYYLFGVQNVGKTPTEMADRVRQFVKQGGIPT